MTKYGVGGVGGVGDVCIHEIRVQEESEWRRRRRRREMSVGQRKHKCTVWTMVNLLLKQFLLYCVLSAFKNALIVTTVPASCTKIHA